MLVTASSQPLFLFYLVNAKGESYYRKADGSIAKRGLPTPLEWSPDGWQAMTVGWERNMSKFGLVRNFTLSLTFLEDGAQILKEVFYNGNVDSQLWLLVQKRTLDVTLTDYAVTYPLYYKGEIDFSTFRGSHRQAQVNIMEGGRSKELRAGEGTLSQFPLEVSRSIRVKMDGMDLTEVGNFVLPDELEIAKTVYGTNFFLPFTLLNTEGSSSGVAFFSQDLQDVSGLSWDDRLALNNFLAVADQDNTASINVRIRGKIYLRCLVNDPGLGFRARFIRTGQLIGNQNDYEFIAAFNPVVGQTYELDIDMTVPIAAGQRIHAEGIYFGGVTGAVDIKIDFLVDSKLTAEFTNRHRTTYCRAFLIDDFFKQLIGKVCGSEAYAVSTLLDGMGLAVTSGDGLRGISGAYVKTKLQDFERAVQVLKCAGMGVEGQTVALERIDHFINDDTIVQLGEVKALVVEPCLEVMFNTIQNGYNDRTIDDYNGRYAFNMRQVWATIIKRVVKALDLVCPYHADPFDIETIRRNLDNKQTTDANTDNEVYLLAIDRDAPAIENFSATRNSNNTVAINSGDPIPFESTSGSGFSANINLSEFTFQGVAGTPADLDVSAKVKAQLSGDVFLTLYKNAQILGQVSFAGNGAATNGVTASTTLDPGDIIKAVLLHVSAGIMGVIEADLSIDLAGSQTTYNLLREVYTSVNGIPNGDTVFNIEHLSPKRILNAWKPFLRGACLGFEGSNIALESATKNRDLETIGGPDGDTIEDADLVISALGDPLFQPKKLSFTASGPDNLVETMADTPGACFEFTYKGRTLKGYFLKGAIQSKENQEQNFVLLSHPDNDLTDLENE
jgi:hypothetical protein